MNQYINWNGSSETKEIYNEIQNLLSNEVSQYSMDQLQKISQNITQYLNSAEPLYNLIKNKIAIELQLSEDKDLNTKVKNQIKYRLVKEFLNNNNNLEQILKNGYAIIEYLRELITKEEIVYSIGISYRGKLYEKNMSLQQVLNLARITPEWGGLFKLRLVGQNRGQLISDAEIVSDTNGSTLYSAIRNYASANKLRNQGNLYETYKVMKYKYRSNLIPPAVFDVNEFIDTFIEVKKNTTSFIKGGDFLNKQYKFFGSSAPSLVSVQTIINSLKKINSILISGNAIQIQSNLLQYFTSSNQDLNHIIVEETEAFTDKELDSLLSIIK